MPTLQELRAKAANGDKVSDDVWLKASDAEDSTVTRERRLGELEGLRTQGEQARAHRQAVAEAHERKAQFERETVEPMRDAYAVYTTSRSRLAGLLTEYEDRWRPIAIQCDQVGIGRPPQLNPHTYLHLADLEATDRGAVDPHYLHKTGA